MSAVISGSICTHLISRIFPAKLRKVKQDTNEPEKQTLVKNCADRQNKTTYLGKASKQYVFFVSGKATLMPDVRGE